jgi:hypothetical protein
MKKIANAVRWGLVTFTASISTGVIGYHTHNGELAFIRVFCTSILCAVIGGVTIAEDK